MDASHRLPPSSSSSSSPLFPSVRPSAKGDVHPREGLARRLEHTVNPYTERDLAPLRGVPANNDGKQLAIRRRTPLIKELTILVRFSGPSTWYR